jgi:hypothetical protein
MFKRLMGVLVFSFVCASAFAKVDVTDQSISTFVAFYPRYVELAKANQLMPTQDTVDQWGTQIEKGTFDAAQMQQPQDKMDAFRVALEKELADKGLTVQDFSELAAKISVIYSNATVEKATKDLKPEEKDGMDMYTKQFDNALTTAGISYTETEVAAVKSRMADLDALFNQTLAGM